ncbi:hypothetical protein B0H10DRAFT_2079108 [Mycena sp. CBHHK59/15]|nr:hypothetical protein B0H10DRAFT_2079108 [Mycena sp. CBHHK59/15]
MRAGAGAVVVEHSSSAVSISSSAKLKSEATCGIDGMSIIEVPAVGASVHSERGEVRRHCGEGEEVGVGVRIGMCTGIDVGGEAGAVTAACGGGASPSHCPIRTRALRGTATTDRTPAPCRRPWRRCPRQASVAHARLVNASHVWTRAGASRVSGSAGRMELQLVVCARAGRVEGYSALQFWSLKTSQYLQSIQRHVPVAPECWTSRIQP